MIYPDLYNIVWHRPYANATGRTSFARCRDGRVIFCFHDRTMTEAVRLSKVTYGYAANYTIFLIANCISSVVSAFEDSARGMLGSVFNVDDDLYIGLNSYPVSGVGTVKVEIYRSLSGNGVDADGVPDWVLHSTMWEWERNGGYFFGDPITTGTPYVTGGRWIMMAPCMYFGIAPMYHAGVFTSDDGGYTWTQRYHRGIGAVGGAYLWNACKMIVEYQGSLYSTVEGNTSDGVLIKGDLSGENWITLYGFSGMRDYNASTGHALINKGNGWLHCLPDLYGGGWLGIYESYQVDDVEHRGHWLQVKDYHMSGVRLWDGQWPYTAVLKNEFDNDILLIGLGGYVSNGTPPTTALCACKASNKILSAQSRRYIVPEGPDPHSNIIIP